MKSGFVIESLTKSYSLHTGTVLVYLFVQIKKKKSSAGLYLVKYPTACQGYYFFFFKLDSLEVNQKSVSVFPLSFLHLLFKQQFVEGFFLRDD